MDSHEGPPKHLAIADAAFLSHWFRGLAHGLEQLDHDARQIVLSECGRACAESYTLKVFREAWIHSSDLESFLRELEARFPDAQYSILDEQRIEVEYRRCGCDLVTAGLIRSPSLCECSAYNLEANFEATLGGHVKVTLEASILSGSPTCRFVIALDPID